MSDERTNEMRDRLIASAPDQEGVILSRDEVIERWCRENGVAKDDIGIKELLEIRSLPEWQNAS